MPLDIYEDWRLDSDLCILRPFSAWHLLFLWGIKESNQVLLALLDCLGDAVYIDFSIQTLWPSCCTENKLNIQPQSMKTSCPLYIQS